MLNLEFGMPTMQPTKYLREKRLQQLGETLNKLTPQERAAAVKVAARLLAAKKAPKKG